MINRTRLLSVSSRTRLHDIESNTMVLETSLSAEVSIVVFTLRHQGM